MEILALSHRHAYSLGGDADAIPQAQAFLRGAVQARGAAEVDVAESNHERFIWLDVELNEIVAAPEAWRDSLLPLTGEGILDLHLQDATNTGHPSYFDTTQAYDMVVFRKLSTQQESPAAHQPDPLTLTRKRRGVAKFPVLAKIETQPVTFFVFQNVLITVRPGVSRTIEQVRQRLLALGQASNATNVPSPHLHAPRLPKQPEDLMLRLLNGMVDRYLDLRAPLTQQLDRWQRALLDPQQRFSNWQTLLDVRIQLRKLEHLCEEQHDAMQEFRDSLLEAHTSHALAGTHVENDALLVRIHDVIEHISRVLAHARRLEDSIESAVQIHFSAVAHRTNDTMRFLTLLTAIFMPLTLITGVFGMNFEVMPWIKHPAGFTWAMGLMVILVLVMIGLFYLKRYLDRI